jgi:hypothetical protein
LVSSSAAWIDRIDQHTAVSIGVRQNPRERVQGRLREGICRRVRGAAGVSDVHVDDHHTTFALSQGDCRVPERVLVASCEHDIEALCSGVCHTLTSTALLLAEGSLLNDELCRLTGHRAAFPQRIRVDRTAENIFVDALDEIRRQRFCKRANSEGDPFPRFVRDLFATFA